MWNSLLVNDDLRYESNDSFVGFSQIQDTSPLYQKYKQSLLFLFGISLKS